MDKTLLWFRNDLRTHDNPALHHFCQQRLISTSPHKNDKAIFFVSHKQWRKHHWSDIKIDLIERHANALVAELDTIGITLDIVQVDDFDAQVEYLKSYCQQHSIDNIIANSELEINEQRRDQKIVDEGLSLTLFEADVIVPKGKVLNKSGEMFKVFTPFKRAWLSYLKAYGFEYLGKTSESILSEPTELLGHEPQQVQKPEQNSPSAHWPLASIVETQVLPKFLREKVSDYAEMRDFPGTKGTSGLSPYLAAGLVSPRYVLRQLLNQFPDLLSATDSPEFSWLNELIWREFYRHLMFHQPRLCKHECFNLKYQDLDWPNRQAYFEAWCQGKTGYPIVDAAMRQLNQTGWMHNRLRMIVASFLTKHLLVDWRKGEQYFMEQLIDGDLAANNGGWQWAASTGCDAQPYFRVFNPIRQSERFDPDGDFIRKFIPELETIPAKEIHFPHNYLKKQGKHEYWPAIVDHKPARELALAFYK